MFVLFESTTISNQFRSREFQEYILSEDKLIVVKFGQLAAIDESPWVVNRLHLAKFRDVNPLHSSQLP